MKEEGRPMPTEPRDIALQGLVKLLAELRMEHQEDNLRCGARGCASAKWPCWQAREIDEALKVYREAYAEPGRFTGSVDGTPVPRVCWRCSRKCSVCGMAL